MVINPIISPIIRDGETEGPPVGFALAKPTFVSRRETN